MLVFLTLVYISVLAYPFYLVFKFSVLLFCIFIFVSLWNIFFVECDVYLVFICRWMASFCFEYVEWYKVDNGKWFSSNSWF